MHRKVGLAALEQHTRSKDSYNQLSAHIFEVQLSDFQVQLTQFRSALQHFALKHRKTIASDPTFRAQFQRMCANVGVDPLSGPKEKGGGAWLAESFGFLSDWTFELAVQIVDICVNTREMNGGVIEMDELIRLLRKLRGLEGENKISVDDVMRSIKALEPLGAGYEVIDLGYGKLAVRSVVQELDEDQGSIIVLAAENEGLVNEKMLIERYGWTIERARIALSNATERDGICWVDNQTDGPLDYYVLGSMKWDDGVD
jgi:ESCRT-II complex subunit VPS22